MRKHIKTDTASWFVRVWSLVCLAIGGIAIVAGFSGHHGYLINGSFILGAILIFSYGLVMLVTGDKDYLDGSMFAFFWT